MPESTGDILADIERRAHGWKARAELAEAERDHWKAQRDAEQANFLQVVDSKERIVAELEASEIAVQALQREVERLIDECDRLRERLAGLEAELAWRRDALGDDTPPGGAGGTWEAGYCAAFAEIRRRIWAAKDSYIGTATLEDPSA